MKFFSEIFTVKWWKRTLGNDKCFAKIFFPSQIYIESLVESIQKMEPECKSAGVSILDNYKYYPETFNKD